MLRTLWISVLAVAVSSARGPFYRRDYLYVWQYDAFYKFHEDQTLSWNTAWLTCKGEGTTLFYPETADEWNVVKNALRNIEQNNTTFIYVGIQNQLGVGEYITVDGKPTPLPILKSSGELVAPRNDCVLMNTADGSYDLDTCDNESSTPFICKKEINHGSCPTIDTSYKFSRETKKCYKFNNLAKTWQQAMQTCYMEGGSLAIIKDSVEMNILKRLWTDLFDKKPRYYVGFRKLYNNDFFTVKGGSFVDGFYQSYNMNDWNSNSGCGTALVQNTNYIFNPSPCSELLPFICEINV